MLPTDNHVHTEWSWDTSSASMAEACRQAEKIGLPAIAFTEHVDFSAWGDGDGGPDGGFVPVGDRPFVHSLDAEGYLTSVARCREKFPGLRIVTGIEAGEPHWFAGGVGRLLATGAFERVLGSLHTVVEDGRMIRADRLYRRGRSPEDSVRIYLAAVLDLIARSDAFEVLAHVDFVVRSWPHGRRYDDGTFEEEYRAVFAALAASGRVLEVNTRSPMVTERRLRWWREEGGERISFGSDAHQAWRVGARFVDATDVAAAAGFAADPHDPTAFWRA